MDAVRIRRIKTFGNMLFWGAMYAFLFAAASVAMQIPIQCIKWFPGIGAVCGILIEILTSSEKLGWMQIRLRIMGLTLGCFFPAYFVCIS